MRLNRRPTLHTTAGVVSSDYWEFQPGQKVLTREGVIGTVEAVNDGPFPGSEEYQVVLDGGLGGGAYAAGELGPVSGATTALRASQGALTADIQGTTDPLEHWQEDEQADADRAPKGGGGGGGMPGLPKLPGLPEGAGAEEGALALMAARIEEEEEQHLASQDYPELGTILQDRPPIERMASKEQIESEAGIMDFLFHPVHNLIEHTIEPGKATDRYTPGANYSFDWCRFRHNSHCYYPKQLDEAATRAAGYAVWVPEDRGQCPRLRWTEQQLCPIGAPGPHSGDPHALTDATVPWNQGGQHGGRPGPGATDTTLAPYRHGSLEATAATDEDFAFHFTSSWSDVQAKAKKIRSEGGVRIISTPDGRNPYITAEVNGAENVYQTTILRTMGGKSVAAWECGCAWSSYSWGRTGRWKKYEGRMCSHALATVYQAQADEMFGGRVKEIETKPIWSDQIRQPGSWDKDKGRHTGVKMMPTSDFDHVPFEDDPSRLTRLREDVKNNGIKTPLEVRTFPGDKPFVEDGRHRLQVARDLGLSHVPILDWNNPDDQHDLMHLEGAHTGRRKDDTEYICASTGKVKEEPFGECPHCGKTDCTLRVKKQGAYTFDVDFSHSKDTLKNGEVVSGTHRVSTDGANETEARLVAEQMVAATGHEPTKVRRVSVRALNTDPSLQEPPIQAMAKVMLSEGEDTNEVLGYLVRMGTKNAIGILVTAMQTKPFKGTVNGVQYTFVDIMGDSAVTDGGDRYPMDQIEHADFDPHSGLDYHEGSLQSEAREFGGTPETNVVHPGFDPNGIDNPEATKFEHMPEEHRTQISKNVYDNSPDPDHRLTHETMVRNIVAHAQRAGRETPDAVKTGHQWYRGAHQMTKDWAGKHGMSHVAAAGVTAAMSPNTSWEGNVTGAHYMIRHLGANNHINDKGDDIDHTTMRLNPDHVAGKFLDEKGKPLPNEKDKNGKDLGRSKAEADYQKVAHLGGKKFHDMTTNEAADAIRYQAQHVDHLKNEIGNPKKAKGGGMPATTFTYGNGMRKAVRIARGEHPDKVLGGHKVRSFYNNIIDPHDRAGQSDVTMDSHAISAASNAKFSGGAMKPIFDTGGEGEADRKRTQNGKGTYSMFASAYREAHRRLQNDHANSDGSSTMSADSKPCDTQAVVWNEWKRQMDHKSNKNKDNAFPVVDEETHHIPGFDKDGNHVDPNAEPAPPVAKKPRVKKGLPVAAALDEWLFTEAGKDGVITHLDLHPIHGETEDHSDDVIDPMDGDDDEPDPDIYPDENAEWHRKHDHGSGSLSDVKSDQEPPHDHGTDDHHTSVIHLIADMMMNDDPYPMQGGEAGGQLVNGVLPFPPDEWTGGDSGRPDETNNGDDDDVTRGEIHDAEDGMTSSVTANSHEDERKKHKKNCPYCHGVGCNLCGFMGYMGNGYVDPDHDSDDDQGDEDDSSAPASPGTTSDLHDEPEPALPETDGSDEDDIKPGDPKLAWLQGGGTGGREADNAEIATMARQTLAKMALKDFTQAERAALIAEGEGTVASNLGSLDISGTHYMMLEESLSAEDQEDDTWLS